MNKSIRKKTVRRLTLLLLGAFLVAAGGLGFYGYRKAKIRLQYAHLRADGLAAARRGDNAIALDYLGRYLAHNPSDLESLEQFARLRPLIALPKEEHLRQTTYALRQLLKVQSDAQARRATQIRLLDLYTDPRMRFWTEADQLAQSMLPNASAASAADVGVLSDWTRARLALQDFRGALEPARRWSSLAPLDLEAQMMVLQLAHQTQSFERIALASKEKSSKPLRESDLADALVGAMNRQLPTTGPSGGVADPRPRILKAFSLILTGHRKEAADLADAAAAHPISDRKTVDFLIYELDSVGHSEKALDVLKGFEAISHDIAVRDMIVRRSWEAGDYQTVADLLAAVNPADSGANAEILALRASALAQLGHQDKADAIRQALAKRDGDPVAVAWVQLLQPSTETGAAPRQLARDCEAALQVQASPYLTLSLGMAYGQLGQTQQAMGALRDAATKSPTWAAPPMEMSRLLAASGQLESALGFAREALRRAPRNPIVATNLVRIWAACIRDGVSGGADQLLDLVDQIRKVLKNDGEIAAVKADVLAMTDRAAEAKSVINEALDAKDIKLGRPLLQMAGISRSNKLGLEQPCLDRYQKEYGATPDLALARATMLIADGHPDDGTQLFEQCRVLSTSPQTVAWRSAWCRCLDLAAQTNLQAGKTTAAASQDKRAASELASLAEDQQDNLSVQLQVLDSSAAWSDRSLIVNTIQRVRNLSGEQTATWRLAEARLLLSGTPRPDQVQQASNLLSEAMRLAPDSLQAHVLRSRAAELDERLNDAVAEMKVASGLSPRSVAVGISLATLLEKQGSFDEARDELMRIRALPRLDPNQRWTTADLATQAHDTRLALALFEDMAAQGRGGTDLLTAKMYWLGGNPKEAQRICDELLKKPAESATVKFAAELDASQGDIPTATTVLSKLDGLNLEPGQKELAWADFAGRYIGPDGAVKYLEQAVRVAPNNPLVWKAIIAFHLSVGQHEEAASDVSRAAAALPSDPLIAQLKQNCALLTSAIQVPELREFAVAFARNPADPALADSLRELTGGFLSLPAAQQIDRVRALADRYPQSLLLQLYCIQCYDRADSANRAGAGRSKYFDEAIKIAVRTCRHFPGAAEPYAAYAMLLEENQRWSDALAEAQKWRDRMMVRKLPADLEIAKIYLQLKRPDEAIKQLEPYRNSSVAEERQAALPLLAQVRQMAGSSTDDTVQLMAPLLSQGPNGLRAWIQYAINNLDPVLAGGWLDRAERVIPADSVKERLMLGEAWGTLAHRDRDPADLAHAMRILQALCDKPDASPLALLALAMEQDKQNQFAEAMACYQRALKLAPNDVVLKNNLAMDLLRTGGKLDEAWALINSAVETRPDLPPLYDTRATIELRQQKYQQAVASAREAVTLQPRSPQYLLTLTQALLGAGQYADAIGTFGKLNELHVDDAAQSEEFRNQRQMVRSALGG